MGQVYHEITPTLGQWLHQQPVFFVATASLAAEGYVNCSPKGGDRKLYASWSRDVIGFGAPEVEILALPILAGDPSFGWRSLVLATPVVMAYL